MRKFFLLLFILWRLASAPSLGALAPWVMRISCGARVNVYTAPRNTIWYKDFAYTGGVPFNATRPSSITPPLATLRYFPMFSGPNNCYNIRRVPTGHYAVRVFFGLVGQEVFDDDPLFDVSIGGTQTCSLLPGWSIHDDQTFSESQVFLMDGEASICFHSTGHGDPAIISIEILQIDYGAYYFGLGWGQSVILRTVTRLSCGNGNPMFDVDYGGDSWGGDRFWSPIKTFGQGSDQAVSTEIAIMQASNVPNFYPAALYQTAIVGTDTQPDLTYTREVESNGTYSIWFHFAEIDNSIKSIGERVFDILINGDVVFGGVDIVKMSGDRYTALVLNTTVAVDGRSLTITLRPKPGSHAIINAIEVFEILTPEAKTLPEEVATLQSLKSALGLPLRFGWNGDPCVPQQHPWSGADCQFDRTSGKWFIDGLGLDDQGLSGFLPNDISGLGHLQTINLSSNSILGAIPASMGNVTGLEVMDLSYNFFNGSIPESLGQLTSLQKLNLNGNSLSGRVPAALGGMLLHGASFNFTDNAGLCGIPGLPSCGAHLTAGAKTGIAFGASAALLLVVIFSVVSYKRRQNINKAQQVSARGAPYAKARTQLSQDIQTTRIHNPGHARTASGNGMGQASHHDRTTIT